LEETTNTAQSKPKVNLMVIGGAAVILLAIGAVVVFGMVGGKQDTSSKSTTSPIATVTKTSESQELNPTSAAETIKIEGANYRFSPNIIRIKKGKTIKIELTSKDMMHDFVIDEFDVRTEIAQAGETTTVEFTATEIGEFEYYCSVGNHRAQGMVGTLIVEE